MLVVVGLHAVLGVVLHVVLEGGLPVVLGVGLVPLQVGQLAWVRVGCLVRGYNQPPSPLLPSQDPTFLHEGIFQLLFK